MIFSLQIGINKSRIHYVRGPKLQISWFLNVLTRHRAPKPTLFILKGPGHFEQIKNKYGNILEHIIFGNMTINIFENFRKCVYLFSCFVFLKFWVPNLCIIISEDEDRKMIHFPLMQFTKSWIWISYLSNNMKWKFGKS